MVRGLSGRHQRHNAPTAPPFNMIGFFKNSFDEISTKNPTEKGDLTWSSRICFRHNIVPVYLVLFVIIT